MSKLLERMLVKNEGLKLKPYRCTAGKLTIGVGRNLDDVGISEEEAHVLLKNDIVRARAHCESYSFWNDLDDVRQAVLIDMCVNLGAAGLDRFKRMLAAVDDGLYATAADEMMNSRWATQVGRRSERLAKMMRTGIADDYYK